MSRSFVNEVAKHTARRARLQRPGCEASWPLPSDGIMGPGRLFFEQAVRQGQEGVMAKHLASRYLPGLGEVGGLILVVRDSVVAFVLVYTIAREFFSRPSGSPFFFYQEVLLWVVFMIAWLKMAPLL